MEQIRAIIITTGYSTFIPILYAAEIVNIVGVLDCVGNKELNKYVEEKNIPYKILIHQNHELQEWIKTKGAHIIIVYKMPFLLKKEIFTIPKYGSINIHPSLLPQYRGPNPWFWTYYNMEKESGVTIHRIDEKEDHGEILAQAGFNIKLGACLNDLRSIVETKSVLLLKKILPEISIIKDNSKKSYNLTFRAYNTKDYKSIIDIKKIDGINLWHILRGFPNILTTLFPHIKNYQKIEIADFTVQPIADKHIGSLKEDESNIFLFCKNGIIKIMKSK